MCGADRNALLRHHLIPIMCFGTDCAPQYTNIEEEHCVMPHDTSRGRVALVLDVEPLAGRVVAFNSLLHHEVLPVAELRCAITLWFWIQDGNLEKSRRS